MKQLFVFLLIITAGGMTSCNKYLDVAPKSSLADEQLFTSESGFKQALNGVYAQMAQRELYGDNLSMGFVSALAQNYAVAGASAPLVQTRALNYASEEVTGYTNAIWSTSYAAIAGVNKILEYVDVKKDVLSAAAAAGIRGEALGLRAYLHFEVLRMFASNYANGAGVVAIPYQTSVSSLSTKPSSLSDVVTKLLADLSAAEALLKDTDPIMSGTTNRQINMNYYAVKGLQARVNIFRNNREEAYKAAEVIVNSGRFPFVTPSQVSAPEGSKNRLFKSELVFALRVRNIKTWAEGSYFKFFGNASMRLTRSAADFKTLYEVAAGGATDIRYNYLIEDDKSTPFPSKFWQTYSNATSLDSFRLDQLVPLIRLSEMYYILAEAAPTPQAGMAWLNKVRNNRSLPELPIATATEASLKEAITREYQKEFYAEGQLFYYYKRLNFLRMQFRDIDMTAKQYILPIPDGELEFNPNY
jgi:hypothetical protein